MTGQSNSEMLAAEQVRRREMEAALRDIARARFATPERLREIAALALEGRRW
jgi:hypothetical protein